MKRPYQPKTGARCGCKRGVHRDNCPNCEGTGWVVDFKAIRERRSVEADCDSADIEELEAASSIYDSVIKNTP